MKKVLSACTILLAVSQGLAQKPMWQGRSLDQWLAKETRTRPVSQLFRVDTDYLGALAALGPGSLREKDALAELVRARTPGSLRRPHSAVSYVGAFGKAGMAILKKELSKSNQPERLAGAVARAGKAGVSIVLEHMRTRPRTRSLWVMGCGLGSKAFFAELSKRLPGARGQTARDIRACIAMSPWSSKPAVARPAKQGSTLRDFAPKAIFPILDDLAAGRTTKLRGRELRLYLRCSAPLWSSAQSSKVDVLRACLRTGDSNACESAAVLLVRIGDAASIARPELLTAAGSSKLSSAARWACLRAAWLIRAPGKEDMDQLRRLRSESKEMAGWLLKELGTNGLPLLRIALADEKLRGDALAAITELGPDAKTALPELNALLESGVGLLPVAEAIVRIDSERWPRVEARVLSLAHNREGKPLLSHEATLLLMLHGQLTPPVLQFFEARFRDARVNRKDRETLQTLLLKGGAVDAFVAELAAGKLDVGGFSRKDRLMVDALCQWGRLAPAVPWLRKRLDAAVKAREVPIPRGIRGCIVIPSSRPRLAWARFVGAAGKTQRAYLTRLSNHEHAQIQGWGFAGLGQMARTDPATRRFLVDELIRMTGGAEGTTLSADAKPRTDGMGPVNSGYTAGNSSALGPAVTVRGASSKLIALVQGLGNGGPATVRALAKRLDPRARVRCAWILCVFARAGSDAVAGFSQLLSLLDHEDATVAALALNIGRDLAREVPADEGGAPDLLGQLRDATAMSPRLQVDVHRYLGSRANQILSAAAQCRTPVKRWIVGVASTSRALARMTRRGRVIPLRAASIAPLLQDSDIIAKRIALDMLWGMMHRNPKVVYHYLRMATSDPSWDIRALAVRGLAGAPKTSVVENVLKRCLEDPDHFVRAEAHKVLAHWLRRK